ncbi:MICOS complex subunit mic60 [Claviceps sp. LM458 group G5]|nr:MICOS complex subunit mic60 [Claviceps sp. LM458 group G5]
MLRSSLRSARAFGGQPVVASAQRQWSVATSRQLGERSYAVDSKKQPVDVATKPIVLPTTETLSSERNPPPSAAAMVDAKTPEIKAVPLMPPPPPPVVKVVKTAGKATPPPPPPPAPKKRGFFSRLRRLVFTLMLLGVAGFAGGVWYSRINDNFHDFFTEYVPFGEQAVLYLEELEFKRKYPHPVSQVSRVRDAGKQILIPAQSGASWRVADQAEPSSRHSSAARSDARTSAVQPTEKKDVADKTPADPVTAPAKPAEKATPKITPSETATGSSKSSAKGFKEPEVDEPSRFPPLQPIDLMQLPDAKEPIVRDLVHMLNDLILVVNADGAHGRYSTTIAKAKNEIVRIGSRLKDLKSSVEKQAASQVKSSIDEFDHAATDLIKRVENTMATQEVEWRREFEQEMESVRRSYDERVSLLMEREKKLNDEKLQTQLLEQALALKKEFVQEVKERVERERQGRLGKLSELTSAVSDLEKLTLGWNGVVDNNLKTQQLHVAVEAVRASLENSTHPKPFIRELIALKGIAGDDAVVDAAIATINPTAYQRGVTPPSQLIDRFRRVAGEVRKASLLPEDAGVASHASSWILSHIMFKKEGLADGNDVESILTRTQTFLEEGDLDSAAREMNGLQGWAKALSRDWLGEVRKVLEVQQALDNDAATNEVRARREAIRARAELLEEENRLARATQEARRLEVEQQMDPPPASAGSAIATSSIVTRHPLTPQEGLPRMSQDSGAFLDPLSVISPADFVKRMSGLGYDMPIYRLFWNALKPSTRKTYLAATRSVVLVHWISGRVYGKYNNLIKKQRQVRPATASAYVAALRSVHIDLDLPKDLFDGLHVRRLVSGTFGTFPQQKPQHSSEPRLRGRCYRRTH